MTYSSRRNSSKFLGAAALAAAALLLSGCSFSANTTLAADDVAALAAQALGEQWDTEPTVDCGDESIDAVEGTTVECEVFNPKSGLDYPAMVTLTEVDGSNVTVGVQVGNAIVDEESSGPVLGQTGETQADAPTVGIENFVALAAGALETELGYAPALDCGTQPISVFVGATVECLATADDGLDYPAHVVVTEVGETDYNIDVTMDAAPAS